MALGSVPRERNSRAHAGSEIKLFVLCQLQPFEYFQSQIPQEIEYLHTYVPKKRLATSLCQAISRLEVGTLRRIWIQAMVEQKANDSRILFHAIAMQGVPYPRRDGSARGEQCSHDILIARPDAVGYCQEKSLVAEVGGELAASDSFVDL